MRQVLIIYLTETPTGDWRYGRMRMGMIMWERGTFPSEAEAKREAREAFSTYQISFRKGA